MSTVTSRDGTTIAYERTGHGPPLVLVDGAMCHRAAGPMRPLAAALAGDLTVLAYDRRGRAESGDTPPYAVEREVEDLAAVLDAAGGVAAVYGISSGAGLVLEAAARGLRITRLAVYEPPYNPDEPTARREAADYARDLGEVLAAGRPGDAVALFLTVVGVPAATVEQMRGGPDWAGLEAIAPTLAYDSAVMGDAFGGVVPVDRLASVPVPALVLAGGASPPFMHDAADTIATALPDAERRTLDGQTHAVTPEALAPVLREFLLP